MSKVSFFSDDKYSYSVALMFAYINLCKPEKHKLNVDELKFNLEYNCLANKVRPIDILNNYTNKKYKNEIIRIKNANTKYPIILDSNYNIVDGLHRYMKHIIEKKKIIYLIIYIKIIKYQ